MGMFNNVCCEANLPDGRTDSNGFQTKQFSAALINIVITKGGKLLFENEEVPFHGWLYFYDTNKEGEFCEYYAKFSNGTLEGISTDRPLPWEFFETR